MLDERHRRALIVEAHHLVRGTKERFIASLSGDRPLFDAWSMPDRPLTDVDATSLTQLTLAQVAALDKLVEGALGVALFGYLQLIDGFDQPCGLEDWAGLDLSLASAASKPYLHDDFYPVYSDMRRYEAGDHSFDVRDGFEPKTKLS